MRVSLIQLSVTDAEPAAERRERATELVRAERAHGADLVVLPELWLTGGFASHAWASSAETVSPQSPTYAAMSQAAVDLGGWLHAGSIVERGTDRIDLGLYNTSLVFASDGSLARTYRKIHRFGFDQGEAAMMQPGHEVVTLPTSYGTLGLATCYDLRFPELFRLLTDAGTEHVVICAAWPERRIEHWRILNRARAIESQVYVFAVNCVGEHAGTAIGGRSVVVDPWGTVVAEAGTGDEVLRVDVDPALVAETRTALPVLRDQRLRANQPA